MYSTKISLGSVQFGLNYGVANSVGQVSLPEVQSILKLARKNNIDILDTAIAYGKSEEILGKAGISGFRVVTKLPELPADCDDILCWVEHQVDFSLNRLKQKKLYGLLLHRPQDLLGFGGSELREALMKLKSDDVVRKIGVSIYGPEDLDMVYGKMKIDLVQAPFNVVDRRMELSGWLDRLKDDGVEVHCRSVFLQGLLLMEQSEMPKKFMRWSGLWEQWKKTLEKYQISPLLACLAYPISLSQVDQIIVGVDSAKQLNEIIDVSSTVDHAPDMSFLSLDDIHLIDPSNWNAL